MVAAAVTRVPVEWRLVTVYVALAAVMLAAGVTAGVYGFRTRDLVQTRTVTLSPRRQVARMSAAELVAALGRPDQTQTQNGVVCDLWQGRGLEVCYRP